VGLLPALRHAVGDFAVIAQRRNGYRTVVDAAGWTIFVIAMVMIAVIAIFWGRSHR
jgi:hypothetical protein